jgi:phenylacetate-CoA ligase
MEGFLGRSDSMVKLRGINIFPQALSSILAGAPGFKGEYICILTRAPSGRDELLVRIETTSPSSPTLIDQYRTLLKRKLGVEVSVELVTQNTLSPLTGVESRQKPIRLLDKR